MNSGNDEADAKDSNKKVVCVMPWFVELKMLQVAEQVAFYVELLMSCVMGIHEHCEAKSNEEMRSDMEKFNQVDKEQRKKCMVFSFDFRSLYIQAAFRKKLPCKESKVW